MNLSKLDHLQSTRILPIARAIFTASAFVSLLIIVGAVVWIVLLQFKAMIPAHQERVPDLASPPPLAEIAPAEIDLSMIEKRLAKPKNIRLVAMGRIEGDIRPSTPVATVQAETVNDLAPSPDDLIILGGKDAALFQAIQLDHRSALALAPSLLFQINGEIRQMTSGEIPAGSRSRDFELRLAVRDVYGAMSVPENVVLTLTWGRDAPAQAHSEPQSQALTPWQELAREIALALDPGRSPTYFEMYRRALEIPRECGVGGEDNRFVADARNVFESLKQQLTTANVEAFYDGLCSAWRQARSKETDELRRANEARDAAITKAKSERDAIIARNKAARARAQSEAWAASAQQWASLPVIGGAIIAFLFTALLLAFLAMESHSKSIRLAIEQMARNKGE